jgi:flagellar motor switch protein FliN/FliY
MSFLDCWTEIATTLFAQALAGEPELVESFPRPLESGSFGFAAAIEGDEAGRFSITLDAAVLESPLLGEGVDQKAAWNELLREVCEAAAGEILAKTGKKLRVVKFEAVDVESQVSRAFQLRSADRAWTVLVRDEVRVPEPGPEPESRAAARREPPLPSGAVTPAPPVSPGVVSPGVELLLDVELEATLRFGCREMPLGEILELGPGDVVELDRHISDPVDLIVGDKIVARGEVVLVNGNFGLRVTEVAAPRNRLESIRCLF